MASFNFFVVIASLLTTGLVTTLERNFEYYFIGVCLGISLMIIAFVFWKLDQRVRYLIKHAEEALKHIEESHVAGSSADLVERVALFSAEEKKTEMIRSTHSWRFWNWQLSYSDCFAFVYGLFSAFGLIGGLVSAIRWWALVSTPVNWKGYSWP